MSWQMEYVAQSGLVHGNDWGPWITLNGRVIDNWVLTVYGNDVDIQFGPPTGVTFNPGDSIKRRVGESYRDQTAPRGFGQIRVKSHVTGANGTYDIELYPASDDEGR